MDFKFKSKLLNWRADILYLLRNKIPNNLLWALPYGLLGGEVKQRLHQRCDIDM